MEGITLKQIAKWCGGTVEPEFEQVRVKGFTKDSRQLAPGNMYVAIQGARVDGHDFVKQVLENGAAAVLVEKRQEPGVPAVLVKDTEAALGSIAIRLSGHHACEGAGHHRQCGKDNHQGDAGGDHVQVPCDG